MSNTPCPTCQQLRPRGTRFYGRVLAAALECPSCGWMLRISVVGKGQRSRTGRNIWDARSSVVTCPGCNTAAIVGLVLWPIVHGDSTRALPLDQVPTLEQARELAVIRRSADGHWMDEPRSPARAEETNLTGKICTCTGHLDFACPLHGFEAQERDKELGVDKWIKGA